MVGEYTTAALLSVTAMVQLHNCAALRCTAGSLLPARFAHCSFGPHTAPLTHPSSAEAGERPNPEDVPVAEEPATRALRIDNFVRPFTEGQVRQLLWWVAVSRQRQGVWGARQAAA